MIMSRIISKVTLDFLHFLHQNRPKWAVSQRQNCCKITKNRIFLNSPNLIFSRFCLTKMKIIVKKRGFHAQNGPGHPLVRSFRFWMATCSKSPNSVFFHIKNWRDWESNIFCFLGYHGTFGCQKSFEFPKFTNFHRNKA